MICFQPTFRRFLLVNFSSSFFFFLHEIRWYGEIKSCWFENLGSMSVLRRLRRNVLEKRERNVIRGNYARFNNYIYDEEEGEGGRWEKCRVVYSRTIRERCVFWLIIRVPTARCSNRTERPFSSETCYLRVKMKLISMESENVGKWSKLCADWYVFTGWETVYRCTVANTSFFVLISQRQFVRVIVLSRRTSANSS